ncbi:protein TsetseEP-like [Macrobrachium rosenbergii]|uniref:protein TsetseEP-like n=1 Tax=Macrobrachium rosenbergii TaxID=79674 RepID=UPI0034D3E01F
MRAMLPSVHLRVSAPHAIRTCMLGAAKTLLRGNDILLGRDFQPRPQPIPIQGNTLPLSLSGTAVQPNPDIELLPEPELGPVPEPVPEHVPEPKSKPAPESNPELVPMLEQEHSVELYSRESQPSSSVKAKTNNPIRSQIHSGTTSTF